MDYLPNPMIICPVIIEEKVGYISFGIVPEYHVLTNYSVEVGHTNSKYLSKIPSLMMITKYDKPS